MIKHVYKIVFKRRDMTRPNLVSAQNHVEDMVTHANVRITCHAALNAIVCSYVSKQFAMSIPAMSLGDWFNAIRKGGT